MMRYNMLKGLLAAFILAATVLWSPGCDNEACGDCGGGLIDGYFYKKVTTEDLGFIGSENDNIPDLELDACIRFQFDLNNEINVESVKVVDDCCCEIYL
ncbi:MAG: hypothetical protein ABIA75_10540 [Candidatus Neomarinimicrobiota bacterium]